MGLETFGFVSDLVSTNPIGASDVKGQGDDHLRGIKATLKSTFPNGSAALYFPSTATKTGAYSVVAADQNKIILCDATSAAFTVSLDAVATLGSRFRVTIIKIDSSVNAVTIDGSGAETIDGATTRLLTQQYEAVTIACSGSAWFSESENLAQLKGAAIASAGTVTLGAGHLFHITGTTTITDIDFTAARNGQWAWLVFDGALTLTHNGTTLLLPGGANITTAANDRALFVQDSSDNVYCLAYVKTTGFPVTPTLAASTTDNAAVRFDGTGGNQQNSAFIIDDSGQVTSFGGNISFPASQSASVGANVLDDYEEGTWTPGISFGGGTTGLTYTSQSGNYTKIGNCVTFDYKIVINSNGSSSGNALVTGLPFTASAGGNATYPVHGQGLAAGSTTALISVQDASATTITLYRYAAGAIANLTEALILDSSTIRGGGHYYV